MPLISAKVAIVTTSWDDGHPLDLGIAELLSKYGLKGTFYVPANNNEHAVMARSELVELSSSFEIGGHTNNHVDLTGIPSSDVFKEIAAGKKVIEDTLGKKLSMFCYPRGHYNNKIKEQVRKAGFCGARSASWFHSEYPHDFYSMHPTLHVYPHSLLVHAAHFLKEWNLSGLKDYALFDKGTCDLKSLSAKWLGRVLSKGGILHIWGHSWEIEKMGLWAELESMFSHISRYNNILHLTNGEIIQSLKIDGNPDTI
jgi:hypothetical protein